MVVCNWSSTPHAPGGCRPSDDPREVLCQSFVRLGEYTTICGRELPPPPNYSSAQIYRCGGREDEHPVYVHPAEQKQLGKEGVGAAPEGRPSLLDLAAATQRAPPAVFWPEGDGARVNLSALKAECAAAVPEAGALEVRVAELEAELAETRLHCIEWLKGKPIDYVPQGIAAELLAMLDKAGMGKPGAKYGNTLFGMTVEALERLRALSSPSAAARKRDWAGPRWRKDGWPLCPFCGEDELFSSNLSPTAKEIGGCYRCNWRPDDPVDLRPPSGDARPPACQNCGVRPATWKSWCGLLCDTCKACTMWMGGEHEPLAPVAPSVPEEPKSPPVAPKAASQQEGIESEEEAHVATIKRLAKAEAEVARLRDRMVAAFGQGTNETHLVEIAHDHEREAARADKAEAERDAALAQTQRFADSEAAAVASSINANAESLSEKQRADAAEAEVLRLIKERDEARKLSDAYYRGLDAAEASARALREALQTEIEPLLRTALGTMQAPMQQMVAACLRDRPHDHGLLSALRWWMKVASDAHEHVLLALAPPNPSAEKLTPQSDEAKFSPPTNPGPRE